MFLNSPWQHSVMSRAREKRYRALTQNGHPANAADTAFPAFIPVSVSPLHERDSGNRPVVRKS